MNELNRIFQETSPNNSILITCKPNELSELVRLMHEHGIKWGTRGLIPSLSHINMYSTMPIPGVWIKKPNMFVFYTYDCVNQGAVQVYTFEEIKDIETGYSADVIVFDDICSLLEVSQ